MSTRDFTDAQEVLTLDAQSEEECFQDAIDSPQGGLAPAPVVPPELVGARRLLSLRLGPAAAVQVCVFQQEGRIHMVDVDVGSITVEVRVDVGVMEELGRAGVVYDNTVRSCVVGVKRTGKGGDRGGQQDVNTPTSGVVGDAHQSPMARGGDHGGQQQQAPSSPLVHGVDDGVGVLEASGMVSSPLPPHMTVHVGLQSMRVRVSAVRDVHTSGMLGGLRFLLYCWGLCDGVVRMYVCWVCVHSFTIILTIF